MTEPAADTRKPLRFANYPGDQRHAVGEVMGPNTLGELMTVVDATYDETADKTRLGFAFTITSDLVETP